MHFKKVMPELNVDHARLVCTKDGDKPVDNFATNVQRRLGIADSPGTACVAHHQLSKMYGLPVLTKSHRRVQYG